MIGIPHLNRSIYFFIVMVLLSCREEETEISSQSSSSPNNSIVFEHIDRGDNTTSIALSWKPVMEDAFRYRIFRSNDNSSFQLIDSTQSVDYIDTNNLIGGIEYYYKIEGIGKTIVTSPVDSGYILEEYEFVSSIGGFEHGYDSEFDDLGNSYIIDRTRGVYVYDTTYLNRLLRITPNISQGHPAWSRIIMNNKGHLILSDSHYDLIVECTINDSLISSYVAPGNYDIMDITLDNNDNLYMTKQSGSVYKLDPAGQTLSRWTVPHSTTNSLIQPGGIQVVNNEVYIGKRYGGINIEVYNLDGVFIREVPFPHTIQQLSIDHQNFLYASCRGQGVIKFNKYGKIFARIGTNELGQCLAADVHPNGDVIASDENNRKFVHRFRKVN